MKNFYPHGHVMPGGDGSGERHPTQQVIVPRTAAIDLSTALRTYSLVKFNSYRKRGKAGSPPATTSNPYAVLKRVNWLAIFSPWYLINNAKRYTTLLLPTIFVSVFIYFSGAAKAQSRPQVGAAEAVAPLMVGQKVPEEFWTKEHLFYVNGDTVRKTLEQYRGKMLVLDFWSTSCASCIAHQKEISRFKENYRDHIAVVMVNPIKTKDDLSRIRMFDKRYYVDKSTTALETIIQDHSLQEFFRFSGYPHYVWINQYDYIQTQTFRNLLDSKYVAPFIDIQP